MQKCRCAFSRLVWLLPAGLLLAAALAGVLAVTLSAPAPATASARSAQAATPARFDRGVLHIYQGSRKITLQVEIARTMEARSQGLMFRRSLPEDAGMLFIFEDDTGGGFWMKNTLIPLSIGFIDSRWRLLQILDMDVAPDPANGPFTIYQPSVRYRYALEVNQGYFKRKGITPGARLELITAR